MLNSATRYIHPTLEIPAKVQSEVFPDVSLSVLDFLQFPLPIVSGTATRHKPSDFFSKDQPNTQNIKAVQKIPVPPAKTVAELVVLCKTAVLSGTHSLKCLHVPSASAERFPVWVIPYWAEVLVLRTTSRKAWGQAEEFLRLHKRAWKKTADGEKTDSIIQEAYDTLACIPWSGNIRGFDEREPLHKLATYASRSWLGTTHENQMLDLLRRDLLFSGSSIEIANMAFFSTLHRAYEHHDTGEYEDSRSFAWVRGIGEALVNGERDGLGTMVNIGGDHWVAIALDFAQSVVWYGDSFGQEPVDEVTSVINWWTHHHTGYEFLYRKLKIASQKDGFSCGLIGPNALGHFYLPETYPLINTAQVDTERVSVLLRVVRRHLDQVDMFEHESEGFQFTFSAPTTESFTEPKTPPRGRSPSFERVITPRNTLSRSSSPGSAITLPITNCSSPSPSSSYIPLPELESDFDNKSALPSPTPRSKNSLLIPLLARLSHDEPAAPTMLPPTISKASYKERVPSISRAAASIKRTFSERKTSTPPVSPEKKKKKKVSAIRTALERSPKGLMRFLKKCTPAEHDQEIQRTVEENERYLEREERLLEHKAHRTVELRDGARIRQKKHRQRTYDKEIALGERTPGGTKQIQKRRIVELEYSPAKRQKHSIAELSRPHRSEAERTRERSKETQKKGRPRIHQARDAVYHNWFSPFLWSQILIAGKQVGWEMSASEIRNCLQKKDPAVFSKIARTTINTWIDRTGTRPKWSENALCMAENGNHQLHPKAGRRGILAAYPDVVEAITKRLQRLRDAAAPITLVTVRGIVVATILKMAPEIFEKRTLDGTSFQCSDSYLRQWLHGALLWSERRATRAAQKLPDNWEDLCKRAFLHIAYSIKEEDIPPELFVNSDQTQVVYAQGSKLTWALTGSRQVTVIGEDKKRAFTVTVSVSNSGTLLPFQAIYQGQSSKTCPSESAPDYGSAKAAGFRFESSKTKTYWSTHETMHFLIEKILVPYFSEQKAKLGLPESQKSIWKIDVWSVHRSKEFRTWMKMHHPNIILDFVPGGTTGVWQACDVGVQRIFKHSLKRSYHEDVVAAVLKQLDDEVDIKIDKKLGVLRDQSVSWLWKAYQTLNDPVIIKKAFEMCCTGNFNLSYDSLTSFEARQELRDLKTADPEFWDQLTCKATPDLNVTGNETITEDDETTEPIFKDDSNLPCEVIIAEVLGSKTRGVASTATGEMVSTAAAESLDENDMEAEKEPEGDEMVGADNPTELGCGKRKRITNRLYNPKSFWRHNDNEASDNE